jgi:serine/threonine-protein kinase RsbW
VTVAVQTLTIDSRTDKLIAVRKFIAGVARESGFNDEDVGKIVLAVDEACTNVIKHAYRFDATKTLTITATTGETSLEVRVRDNGRRFDPRNIRTPDMKDYLARYQKGGLGIYLMKKLMDEVEYRLQPGELNEVRLVKYLNR